MIAPRLRRVLALRDLVVVAAAAMGPAFSLATTMASMIAAAGRWAWLALVIVVVLMTMIAGGYKALGERIGDAGSSYAWIRRAFGPEAGGYGAWVLLVANLFAVQATALPAGAYTLDLVAPQLAENGLAVALTGTAWTVAAALLLWYGLKPTALLALGLLVAEVVVLGGAAGLAALRPRPDAVALSHAPLAWSGILAAIVVGVWMVDGWEVSASTAEEAAGRSSAPGSGGLAGLLLTSAVLIGAMVAFGRLGSLAGFAAHSDDALAYVGDLLGGSWRAALGITVLVSLAASLQTTLIYLSRSIFAMGRDGLVPAALGTLDTRDEPAVAIVAISALSIVFCLATGLIPSASAAFDLALRGTAWFLGVLFVMSAAAAVKIVGNDAEQRLTGAVLPGIAALVLGAILIVSLAQGDTGPRVFITVSAIIGLPLAIWRGRVVRQRSEPGGGNTLGVAFERQRNRIDP